MKNFWIILSVLLCLSGCQREGGPEIWRFAIEETQGSVQDVYAQKFEELIEAKSDGAVDVKVYPYGTLGTSDHLTELLHNGSIQFAMASPGHIGKMIPAVQVLLLHYIFSEDHDLNREVLSTPEIRESFDALYAPKGFKLLSVYSEGWQVWTANKPIRKPEDFAGVKFRIMTSPLLLAAYAAYGASPTPMPYSEVYSGLQLGMIDGQVNPVFAIEEMSFYEVNEYIIFADQSPFYTTAVANREFYEELGPQQRAWVDETVEELEDYISEVEKRFNEERLEVITEKNPDVEIIRLTAQEKEAFRQAGLPVREQFKAMAGEKGARLLELILEEVEAHTSTPGR